MPIALKPLCSHMFGLVVLVSLVRIYILIAFPLSLIVLKLLKTFYYIRQFFQDMTYFQNMSVKSPELDQSCPLQAY